MKIKDLADGITYNFRIRAKTLTYGPEVEANITTGPGEGQGSDLKRVRPTLLHSNNLPFLPPQGAPGPPGEPFISRYGAALTLHWTSGDQGRSPITRYVIEARPSGERRMSCVRTTQRSFSIRTRSDYFLLSPPDEGLWDILIKDIPKEVTSYTLNLEMLREGVTYDFRVIAVNDYGYGTPSAPSPSISGTFCFNRSAGARSPVHSSFMPFVFSPESVPLLRGVVVPGRDRSGGPHLHPPPCLHPHHPRPEQKIHQEGRFR